MKSVEQKALPHNQQWGFRCLEAQRVPHPHCSRYIFTYTNYYFKYKILAVESYPISFGKKFSEEFRIKFTIFQNIPLKIFGKIFCGVT